MSDLLSFEPAACKLEDLLEPGEKGLIIATDRGWQGRLFLWMAGQPRKVHQHENGLSELINHNGDLFTLTGGAIGDNSPGFSKPNSQQYIKNITTGEYVIDVPFDIKHLCSHNGELYCIDQKWHKQEWDPSNFQKDYSTSTLCKITNDKELVRLHTRKALVEAMVSTPEGIIASMMTEPRGEGPHTITNLTRGETLFSRPVWSENHDDLGGYDIGQMLTVCYDGNRVLFPATRVPIGIHGVDGKRVARFPLVDWVFTREREILSLPGKNQLGEMDEIERRAAGILGYSYNNGLGAESSYFRSGFMNRKDRIRHRNDPDCMYRRIALSNFISHRFYIRHMGVFNDHLILAAYQNLYAVPISKTLQDSPAVIDPIKDKLWTFRDNIEGIAIVEGDQLHKLAGNANMKMGRRKQGMVSRIYPINHAVA